MASHLPFPCPRCAELERDLHNALAARARRTDPVTSEEAAESVRVETPKRMTERRDAVLALLKAAPGGMTDETLVTAYSNRDWLPPQSVSGLRTRRHELVQMGRVVDSGRRVISDTGRRCIVWEAAKEDVSDDGR